MKGFAANLTTLFTEAAPLDRPGLARRAGFDGCEILFPYEFQIHEWNSALDGLPVALVNTPPGDWAAGERGWAAVPGRRDDFRAGFERALHYADALGAGHIHVMSGNSTGPEAHATLIENLHWAASQAPGQSLTLEPLNPIDMPGYFLSGFDQANRILGELGLPQVGLQLDFWHVLRSGNRLDSIWKAYANHARHMQIAGLADRTEPDAAAIDFLPSAARNFDGWIAAEYRPTGTTAAGLGWLDTARQVLAEA